MTTSDRAAVQEQIAGSVRPYGPDPSNLVVYLGPRRSLNLTFAEAEVLARDLRAAVFDNAPRMVRVTGYDTGAEPVLTDDPDTYAAEGFAIVHGLQCPGCGHCGWVDYDDAVFVVDEDERWSRAGYWIGDGGKEIVTTGGADTNYEGLGYRCVGCCRPVTLPDDVEEQWI